jgi:xanthine dehydrogenase iron-sulfur cluster and FAD-binding subunit A
MTETRIRSYRGISERAALQYLTRIGGDQTDPQTVTGDDWTATVSSETVHIGPSLTLTEVTVEFTGNYRTLETVIERFSQKAIRAGG